MLTFKLKILEYKARDIKNKDSKNRKNNINLVNTLEKYYSFYKKTNYIEDKYYFKYLKLRLKNFS